MASSGRTPNLKLNQWSLNDKPQMEDVNRDNELIDTTVSGHIADMVAHMTAEEHQKFTKRIVFTEYFGTNTPENQLTFSIKPSFAIAFALDHPLNSPSGDKIASYFGMASNISGSLGISIEGNVVTVKNAHSPNPIYLNSAGVTYCIAAFA